MAGLSSMLTEFLKFLVVFVAFTFVPGIPPLMEFEAYSVTPPKPLTGPLAINNALNNAEKLFENKIHGPEHMEVHNGVLYTTLAEGPVVKIVNDKIVHVVNFIQYGKRCVGLHEPEICGRPLGLTFDSQGFMYVADSYHGIFKVNVTTGGYEKIISMDEEIENRKPKMPNSIVVGSDGSIYWSDSSTANQLHDAFYILLGNANGRLLKYDPVTKTNTVLIDKILLANGVALSSDESFVMVSEFAKSRILKYYLKGQKKGETEVLIDGLPGNPDNIHRNEKGELYVSLALPHDENSPGVENLFREYPRVRKFLATTLYLLELPALMLNKYYPNSYVRIYTHWMGNLAMIPRSIYSDRVTIVFFNDNGKITKSLHSINQGVRDISDMAVLNGHYYLGSFSNPYILRVKASSK